jgi:pyruvate/2-oxoglutarate dehydrogenase complex dihydrolipoamide dehydrogenase (E3) component
MSSRSTPTASCSPAPRLAPDSVTATPGTNGRDPFLLETSLPGVFAVGDVRAGGTRMAAPAVGEGGMPVRLAAEHLARTTTPAPPHHG